MRYRGPLKQPMTKVTLRFSKATLDWIEKEARAKGTSRSEVVVDALERARYVIEYRG